MFYAQVMGMPRIEYANMPAWKQSILKKQALLF
jgi:hypothetical protein